MVDQSDRDKAGSAGDELNDALAQAAALASDLAVALGEAPPPSSAPASPDTASGAPAVDAASLDAELSKLEDLVEEAATEVASQGPESSGGASGMMADFVDPPAASGGEVTAGDVPVAAAAEQGSESDLAKAAQTGVVGTGMLGVVGNMKSPSPIVRAGEEMVDGEASGKASGASAVAASTPMARLKTVVSQRFGPPLYSASERAVGLLEKIDAPFGRVSGKVRDVIGWIALATIATSVLVFLLSSL